MNKIARENKQMIVASLLFIIHSALAANVDPMRGMTGRTLKELKQIGGCAQKQLGGMCSYSYGGYSVTCRQYAYYEAESVCQSKGLRLALANDTTAIFVLGTLAACIGDCGLAWMAGYNGYPADPCMLGTARDGSVNAGLGSAGCEFGPEGTPKLAPVLCQDIPPATSTTSLTTTWSVTQDVQTITLTSTSIVVPTRHHHRHHSDHDDSYFFMKDDCDRCSQVCPYQLPGYRIIQATNVPYERADTTCRQHGWCLGSVTTGIQYSLLDLFATCNNTVIGKNGPGFLWTADYNGISSDNCVALAVDPLLRPDGAGLWGLSRVSCQQSARFAWILCSTNCPLSCPQYDGGFEGLSSVTVSTTTSTSLLLFPSSTTTTTLTITTDCI